VSHGRRASARFLWNGFYQPRVRHNEPPAEGKLPPLRRFKSITPGYLSGDGSRLIVGRDLSWAEIYNKTPVALVSEKHGARALARPRAAIGRRIRATLGDEWREVVGVVGDLRMTASIRNLRVSSTCPFFERIPVAAPAPCARPAYVVRTPHRLPALRQEMQQPCRR